MIALKMVCPHANQSLEPEYVTLLGRGKKKKVFAGLTKSRVLS